MGLAANKGAAKTVAEVQKVQSLRSAHVAMKKKEEKWDKALRRRLIFCPRQHGRK